LVIRGLTLSPLIRRLGLGEDEPLGRDEATARMALAHAALRQIEELADGERISEPTAETARMPYEQRINLLEARSAATPPTATRPPPRERCASCDGT
jgi:hypothetical protein